MRRLLTVTAAITVLLLAACDANTATSTKNIQAEKAQKAADAIRFDENAEIDNIKRRLELTSSPGLLGYVTLINKVGQTVLYTPVKGKITSGGKRLTPPQMLKSCDGGEYGADCVMDGPSDEGTFGRSNDYVFFWTPGGQYFQTSLDYVYSDKPYRLREEPLIDMSDAPAASAKPAQ